MPCFSESVENLGQGEWDFAVALAVLIGIFRTLFEVFIRHAAHTLGNRGALELKHVIRRAIKHVDAGPTVTLGTLVCYGRIAAQDQIIVAQVQ